MTTNQKTILAALRINLERAKTIAMREHVLRQIHEFEQSIAPKPKPTRPQWVDEL